MSARSQNQQQQPARASSRTAGVKRAASGTNNTTTNSEGTTMTNTITATLSQLIRAENNVRPMHAGGEWEAKVEALASSIKAQGLLQNLIGYEVEDGRIAVAGGGRRMEAIARLVERGELAADFPISVKIIPTEQATAASLTENVQREQMHPADEFEAFRALSEKEGWSVDRIADAFGVTPLVVERRLKLAAAAPELVELFRASEITTDQLIALCATDNHERQVEVWNRYKHQHWNRDPKTLRRAVLAEGEVDVSNDPRIPFIGGLAVYKEAGGGVRNDLFTGDGSGGFITDEPLLDKLVADKLEDHAQALRAEGWGWVEVWMEFDHTAFYRFGSAPKSTTDLPSDARAKVEALDAERKALQAEQEAMHANAEAGSGELSDEEYERDAEIDTRCSEIDDEIESIEDSHSGYAPEVLAKSGAIVVFERGKVRIDRGLVRTADRKAVAAAAGDDNAVTGGRETESAGRKADGVSDALRRSLLRQRNVAVQTEVARAPEVAKIVMACWAVEQVRNDVMSAETPVDLAIADGWRGTRTMAASDDDTKAKIEAFRMVCVEAVKGLPKAGPALWDALAERSGEELDALIAVGVANAVSVTEDHKGMTAKLLGALGFDMASHFEPTGVNYLGRVSKGLILEALTEAKKIDGADDRAKLDGMKKGTLAAEAETRLAGSGWVPKGIRTPATKKPKAPAQAKAKAPSKSAPKGKGKAKA